MTASVGPDRAAAGWIDVLWGEVIGEISHAENMEQSSDAHGHCPATAAARIDYSGEGGIFRTCGH